MADDMLVPRVVSRKSGVEAWREALEVIRASPTGEVLNLIVRVENPTEDIPEELEGQRDDLNARVTQLLGTVVPDDLPFTHGQRIFEWTGAVGTPSINQIDDHVLPILRLNPNSRRAMVVIGDPTSDTSPDNLSRSVPAPQVIQFDLEGTRLCVTAYYRAHEIYFFWVVNFIELVKLQRTVCDGLSAGVTPGPITVISHNAYANSAAFDAERKRAALPIERAVLARMSETELEALVERARLGDVGSISELDRLLIADLTREGKSIEVSPYRTVERVLQRHEGRGGERAARLATRVEELASQVATVSTSQRSEMYLRARLLVPDVIKALIPWSGSVPLILALEGVNSQGKWLLELSSVIAEEFPDAKFMAQPTRVSLRDLAPWRLAHKESEFRDYYELAIQTQKHLGPLAVSVVAHSYGSLIWAHAAARFGIVFDKIILVGSVIPRDPDWRDLKFDRLLNEIGGKDLICKLARAVPRMGDSGRRGFVARSSESGTNRVFEMEYSKRLHSDSLSRQHMIAKWVPFLKDGDVIEGFGGKLKA